MTAPDDLTSLGPLVHLLDQWNVPYYIGGSVASSAYGVYRTTADADVIADLTMAHVQPLVTALQGEYYISAPMISAAITKKSTFNIIHLATMFKLDIFAVRTRQYDHVALTRRRRVALTVDDHQLDVPIASPEDVVLSKLEWYRMTDKISERQWLDVVGVLKVQQGRLDYEYMRKWAPEIGVADLLEEALKEAGSEEQEK